MSHYTQSVRFQAMFALAMSCLAGTILMPVLHAQAAEPVSVAAPVAVGSGETEVFCQVGDALQFSGEVATTGDFDACTILIDGAPAIRRTPSLGADHYSFGWAPLASGTHVLLWVYSTHRGGKFLARRLRVVAADTAPYRFAALPKAAAVDTLVTVEASAGTLPSAGTSPSAGTPDSLSRVAFYFNGALLPAQDAAPFSAMLPITAVTTPGKCTVRFIACDSAGHPFTSRTFSVDVPQRIEFSPPSVLTLKLATDKVPLAVSVLPGVSLAKVAYFVAPATDGEWQPLADAQSAPFAASGDLSRFASGSYRLKAEATTASGTAYETEPALVRLVNSPDDQQKAQAAKAQAARDEKTAQRAAQVQAVQAALTHIQAEKDANLKTFLPRPGFDEKIFRRQLAALAYYEVPPQRGGAVGTVTGLGVIQSLNESGEVLRERGSSQTITALVRPGSGQLNFLANAEEDAKISAQQAAEYCKSETSYRRWDWAKYDISVAFSDNALRLGGPSAGLADTVAIMSAALDVPVDSSVAMTGAITLRGQVQPVGGIAYKAEAAFGEANVHTLIVPSDAETSGALFALYTAEPQLCFNRRVVMVTAADQAFAQCFVGWQTFDYAKEEHLIQGGLHHFARGEDKQALAAFSAAHGLDPANWTVEFWIKMVSLVQKQTLKDRTTRRGSSDPLTK